MVGAELTRKAAVGGALYSEQSEKGKESAGFIEKMSGELYILYIRYIIRYIDIAKILIYMTKTEKIVRLFVLFFYCLSITGLHHLP